MDPHFQRFEQDARQELPPPDMSLLTVGMVARAAASATARIASKRSGMAAEATLFAPSDGAFSRPVAQSLAKWKHE